MHDFRSPEQQRKGCSPARALDKKGLLLNPAELMEFLVMEEDDGRVFILDWIAVQPPPSTSAPKSFLLCHRNETRFCCSKLTFRLFFALIQSVGDCKLSGPGHDKLSSTRQRRRAVANLRLPLRYFLRR